MKQCQRLWQALESTPALSGVRATWKEFVGEDLPALEPFLRPGLLPATVYPCPEPGSDGCPRGIVVHAPDDIVAVCRRRPNVCPRLVLTKADIVAYALDLPKLAAHVGGLLGLGGSGPVTGVDGLSHTLCIGAYRPEAGLSFPAYLTFQHDPDALGGVIEGLAARESRPFILVAPTRDLLSPFCEGLLRTHGAVALGLGDFTVLDGNGGIAASMSAGDILKPFHERAVKTTKAQVKDGMVSFHTSADAKWSDVQIRFKDGQTVSVKVLEEAAVLTYNEMGMANAKNANPTKQWDLLRAFAKGNGTLTWDSPDADRKNQKRRENLAKDLQRFFRIEGDPITLTRDRKGWQTRFAVSDGS